MADDKNVADKAAGAMSSLEGKLEKHAGKLPGVSESNKKMIANFLPWVFGAFAALCLFWAKDLWDVKSSLDALGSFGDVFGAVGFSSGELWGGIALFALVAVFVGLAFWRGFMKMTKASWTFAFYGMCAAVIAGLYIWFVVSYTGGRGWMTLLGGLAGLYMLFQVKSMYKN